MKTQQQNYNPEIDFRRVRNFLVATFSLSQKPLNWKLERWNYARFFITPMLVTEGVGDPDLIAVGSAVHLWDEITKLWENEAGEIVGVVNIEHADKTHSGWGEAFIQRHPDYDFLLPEMLAYAEMHLRNEERNLIFTSVYDYDKVLLAAVQDRGFVRNEKFTLWDSVYSIPNEIPKPKLPGGFQIHSMADTGCDIRKRCQAFGVAFNHPDPKDWPSRFSYESLQQAPDYRPDLDVYVQAPGGDYASFCIAWWDEDNKIACLEPVGTAPEYRRKGLARLAVFEAIRRVAALGAKKVFVGSDQAFYLSLGFELTFPSHHWVKKF